MLQTLTVGYPAYAGMDPRQDESRFARPRLPRLRGDGPMKLFRSDPSVEATPPTRGWTPKCVSLVGWLHGYPAYAGMDPYTIWPFSWPWRLPRLRGDGPLMDVLGRLAFEATPPTRGWTPDDILSFDTVEGYPAYAGMDPGRNAALSTSKRLPRLRGDGPLSWGGVPSARAATPPTRGWTLLEG